MSKYLRAHGKPWIERVLTPSLSIIYLPYSEYLEKGFFLYFFPFRLYEIKVGGDSCLPQHFVNTKCKTQNSIKQSVMPPYHNYLSKKFTDCETRYSLLEKTCCTLAWAARRLRQYILTHTTFLISKMDPIKYIFEKPALRKNNKMADDLNRV